MPKISRRPDGDDLVQLLAIKHHMKKDSLQFVFVAILISILSIGIAGQSRTNRIYRPCPTSTTPAVVDVESDGDIQLRACGGHSIFAGTTNLSTFTGGLSGLTTGLVPFWTGTTFDDTNIAFNSLLGTVTIRNGSTAGASFDLNTTIIGDLNGFDTNLYIDPSGGLAQLYGNNTSVGQAGTEIKLTSSSDTLQTRASIWDLSDTLAGWGVSTFKFLRTVTAGGTTGNQTINKPAGTVNIAGGSNSVTITNSTVSANSIVFAVARTNDATCSIKNVVSAAGSFVINMTANCTAETSVGFLVTN